MAISDESVTQSDYQVLVSNLGLLCGFPEEMFKSKWGQDLITETIRLLKKFQVTDSEIVPLKSPSEIFRKIRKDLDDEGIRISPEDFEIK